MHLCLLTKDIAFAFSMAFVETRHSFRRIMDYNCFFSFTDRSKQ